MRNLSIGYAVIMTVCLMRNISSFKTSVVTVDKGGYINLLVGISPDIPESSELVEAIKTSFTEASRVLFVATGGTRYFKRITILPPLEWELSGYSRVYGKDEYDKANVKVAKPLPGVQDRPYAGHVDSCGHRSEYIHLTKDYLTNDGFIDIYGPRGKVLVHEWAKYFWGVYQETSEDEPFYWTNATNGIEATKCPKALRGEVRSVVDGSVCGPDDTIEDMTYKEYCAFYPYATQNPEVDTSMMSHFPLNYVTKFCTDEDHDKSARNVHNRMCKQHSTWSVIQSTDDYKTQTTIDIDDVSLTTPVFTIINPQAPRYVLVLDASESMLGSKNDVLVQAVYHFIAVSVPNDSYVGIVKFNTDAFILSNLTQVNTVESRENLADALQLLYPMGSTCLGCGLELGIEVLENLGVPEGGHLIVFSDGEERRSPFTWEVRDEILAKNIIVDAIFLETTDQANEDLRYLSTETSGEWYAAATIEDMQFIFNQISYSEVTDENSYQLHSNIFNLANGDAVSSTVLIDETIGFHTVFSFTWSYGRIVPNIDIRSPKNCYYTNDETVSQNVLCSSGNSVHIERTEYRSIRFLIPDIAEEGIWTYSVSNFDNNNYGFLTAAVTSTSRGPNSAIVTKSGIRDGRDEIEEAVPIFVKVTQNQQPLVNASVFAIFQGPKGVQQERFLLDNGAGADIFANDGIYSRYFHQFVGSGRYSVQIKVEHSSDEATSTKKTINEIYRSSTKFLPGIIDDKGNLVRSRNAFTSKAVGEFPGVIDAGTIGDFSRFQFSSSFTYTGKVDITQATQDVYPPVRITDLKISQVNPNDLGEGVLLTFTAPGDDFDTGKAMRYDIRYDMYDPTSLVTDFDSKSAINQGDVISGDLNSPSEAGVTEWIIIRIPQQSVDSDGELTGLGIAIRTFDEAGNTADPSNVGITVISVNDISPTSPPTMKEPNVLLIALCSVAVFAILCGMVIFYLHRRNRKWA